MTDPSVDEIVKHLRELGASMGCAEDTIYHAAADEIERLLAQVESAERKVQALDRARVALAKAEGRA